MELVFQNVLILAKTSAGINLFLWTMLDQCCWPKLDFYGDQNRICFQIHLRDAHIVLSPVMNRYIITYLITLQNIYIYIYLASYPAKFL
jgi:hypothetical protein